MCGLLSHTFEPDAEHDLLNDYRAKNKNSRDTFIFISKRQLSENPLEFARRVKLTALSPKCKELKQVVSELIKDAHITAFDKINLIDIYDFEQMIFHSSISEGVWEPDTLFRLFGLYHRFDARERARSDDKLYKLASDIRPISIIPADSIDAPEHRSWEIRRLELYEDKAYVNNLHMPIELGDIFEVTSTKSCKKFILLGQPCDLMVRSKGKRKATEVTFAEIIGCDELDGKSKDAHGKPLHPDAFYELPYFSEDGITHYVSFQKKYTVKLSIIDLCVYQDDGSASLNTNMPCPNYIIPSWENHYKLLLQTIKDLIAQYDQVYRYCSKLLPDEAEHVLSFAKARILALPETNEPINLFTGDINLSEQSISYNLRRSGRLSQDHSTVLLAKFASFIARNAFDHDFGEGREDNSSDT
jgi:hypothetical protein